MKTAAYENFPDDFWCVTGLPGSTGDDFSIDDILDLPNEEDILQNASFLEDDDDNDNDNDKKYSSHSLSSHEPLDVDIWPPFIDDSVSDAASACLKTITNPQTKKTGFGFLNRIEPGKKRGASRVIFIPSAVPVKPRSKRPRTSVNRSWLTGSPSSSSSSSSAHEIGIFFTIGKPALQKPKKKPVLVSGEVVQRQCTHCQVTKTPQWRMGPNGPKTLCNACGVRFKSGRLFPEYRPACSPSFSSEVHSNSHRKVLEMRRKKEITGSVTGLIPRVSSN